MILSKHFSIVAIGMLMLFLACDGERSVEDGLTVFRYNESVGINTLDPAYAKDQAHTWVCNQLFNGLVELDSNLNIRPSIARTWEISAEGLQYLFHLRTDVYFHSNPIWGEGRGRRVNASDFVYSLNRLIDDKVASPGRWVMNPVARNHESLMIDAPNDSTLIIRLDQAYPPFLSLLSMPYCSVVPRDVIEGFSSEFARNPVGTGPFLFKYWKDGVRLVFRRNPFYFEEMGGERLPYLDAVSISFVADKQSAFLEFMQGKLDFLSGADASFKDELLTPEGSLNPKYQGKIILSTLPYLNTEYLGFLVDSNNELLKNSVLSDKRVRQAINYGFDRVKMIRYLRNNAGTPGEFGFVPPGMPDYGVGNVKGYDYNPALARKLLEQAGFPNGLGMPSIPLMTTSSYLDICTFIQAELKKIGIPITIEMIQPSALREMISQSKVLFFRGSWIADYPDQENYLSLFYSANFCPKGPNYTHFKSEVFDAMYERAMATTNDSLRAATYKKMGQLVMDEAPVVVLYYDRISRFTHPYVTGLQSNAMNMLVLKHVRVDR